MYLRENAYVFTASGDQLDLLNPNPILIKIDDIAHQLAMQPRFAGATAFPYSVAQHSIMVAHACPPDLQLWGLLHDAAEAYLGDLVSPLKKHMPHYVQVEGILMRAICTRFGLPWPEPLEVRRVDREILALEIAELIRRPGAGSGRKSILREEGWRDVKTTFLKVFEEFRVESAELLRLLEMARWTLKTRDREHVTFEDPSRHKTITLTHPARTVPEQVFMEVKRAIEHQYT